MSVVVPSRELGRFGGVRVTHYECSFGPEDRPVEEVHVGRSISLVHRGTFQYRVGRSAVSLMPGSVMLANPGPYECSHQHGRGDRCVSFAYDDQVFEEIVRDAGLRPAQARFGRESLPPSARFAAIAESLLLIAAPLPASSEEWAYALAAEILCAQAGTRPSATASSHSERRRAVEACRIIERRSGEPLALATLAAELRLGPFHFLRSFKRALGFTPHQYLIQTRLRRAAALLLETSLPIVEVAFAAGFGDLANFNRSFRQVLGCSPRALRQRRSAALLADDRKICKVSSHAAR